MAEVDELGGLAAMRCAMLGERDSSFVKKKPEAVSSEKKKAEAASSEKSPTVQLFLESTFLFEAEAQIVSASETELLLSATIFHPQGGGQPCDLGSVTAENGSVFTVERAEATERGPKAHILHFGSWRGPVPEKGTKVSLKIDAERRTLCARLHSAGHAIDGAATRAGLALKPAKGYHFPDGGAYVEYDGKVADTDSLIKSLNEHLENIVAEDSKTLRNIDPNTGDRIITIAGTSCPCGGTHVDSTKQLGLVTVTKAKHKSKRLRVSYSVV